MFLLNSLSILCLLLSVLLFTVKAQDTDLENVKRAFDEAHIPENATLKFEPSILLEVAFPQEDGPPVIIKAGNVVPKDRTTSPPFFAIMPTIPHPKCHLDSSHPQKILDLDLDPDLAFLSQPEDPKPNFVIVLVDLDAPTPQNTSISQVRHFLAGNLSTTFGVLLRNSSAAITEFREPGPPPKSDPHRYVFLIYAQPENFDEQNKVTPETPRYHFNVSKFAERVGLGDPLGGTFMLVGPDE